MYVSHVCTLRGQKKASDSQILDLWTVGGAMWVLGPEPGFSARATTTDPSLHNYRHISPASTLLFSLQLLLSLHSKCSLIYLPSLSTVTLLWSILPYTLSLTKLSIHYFYVHSCPYPDSHSYKE